MRQIVNPVKPAKAQNHLCAYNAPNSAVYFAAAAAKLAVALGRLLIHHCIYVYIIKIA
jgi:hypothetical protein